MKNMEQEFMPYSHRLKDFINGDQIRIKGFVQDPTAERFSINLCSDPRFGGTIPLHFQVRFDQKCVVLNTMTRDDWGTEQREALWNLPFKAGHEFEIIIQATKFNFYQIVVNGDNFTTYQARQPMENVRFLYIQGDRVKLHEVKIPTCV